MKPIVYRWDDANAPVARGEKESLIEILRACLVDGYGEKPAAGWTLEFINETEDKAAFRNNPVTGTGFFLQIDGVGTTSATNVRAFETMTSIDDGLFPFYTGTDQKVSMSSAAGTTARPWVLIADDLAFYFVCFPVNTSSPPSSEVTSTSGMFFGDFIKQKPDDAFACMLMPSIGNYGFNLRMDNTTTVQSATRFAPRSSDGESLQVLPSLALGGGPGAAANEGPGSKGIPYVPGDQILLTRPHINDTQAHSFRGFLPGYWYPCHPFPFGQFENVTKDGKTFMSLIGYSSGGYPSSWLIDLEDWRA